MPVGGDFILGSYKHPTLGTGTIYFKAGEDSTIKPGGDMSSDEETGVDTAGNMIDDISTERWSLELSAVNDQNTRRELPTLQTMGGDPQPADWTFTHKSRVIWGGKGKPVGSVTASGKTTVIPLKIAGGGQLLPLN